MELDCKKSSGPPWQQNQTNRTKKINTKSKSVPRSKMCVCATGWRWILYSIRKQFFVLPHFAQKYRTHTVGQSNWTRYGLSTQTNLISGEWTQCKARATRATPPWICFTSNTSRIWIYMHMKDFICFPENTVFFFYLSLSIFCVFPF